MTDLIKSALHEGYALNGTRVHRFTEEELDHGLPFVAALCRAKIRRPIVPVTFEAGIPYCAPCERKAAKYE